MSELGESAPAAVVRPVMSPRALTPREAEVVAAVGRGLPNREVARRLWLSETTVKFHLSRIYRKLGLQSRQELIEWEGRHRAI